MHSQPNILVILTDQQRWDTLGCYGNLGVDTPRLDTLAGEGARYDQCYVNSPLCTPSRASIWTGRPVLGHGVYALHDIMADEQVMFPSRLQALGYDTALIGKLHISGHVAEAARRHPKDGFRLLEWACDPFGFDGLPTAYSNWLAEHHPTVLARFREAGTMVGHLPVEAHFTTWAAEQTMYYLRSGRAADKPFFCCMSVFDPHDPYCNHPAAYEDRIRPDELPAPVAPDEPLIGRPTAHALEHRYSYANPRYERSPEVIAACRLGYHAAVALIDEQVGRVLDVLDEQGLRDDTIVIYTSDHGDVLGDHNLWVKGCYFYEGCTRVPMIVRDSAQAGAQVRPELCQPHDIAATALLAAGASPADLSAWMPEARDLRDPAALAERGYAVCDYRNCGVMLDPASGYKGYFDPPLYATMWREDHWKLALYREPADGCPGELYDLENDPEERRNLWHDPAHGSLRERLRQRLQDWLATQEAAGPWTGRPGIAHWLRQVTVTLEKLLPSKLFRHHMRAIRC